MSITKDYTEENDFLKTRINEQARMIGVLRQKEVDQYQVSSSKDEFKRRNMNLVEENSKLQNDNKVLFEMSNKMFAGEIEKKKKYMQELELLSTQLIVRYDDKQNKFREMEQMTSQKDFSFVADLAKEKQKLKDLEAKVERVNSQLQQLISRRSKRNSLPTTVQEFLKERNAVLDFIMDRGKDIQDRQTENHRLYQQVEQLQHQIAKLQDEIAAIKEQTKK